MVRLGRFGEGEESALSSGILATGWDIADIAEADDRSDIFETLEQTYPSEKSGTLRNWSVQLNQLKNQASENDLVVVPLKTTGKIAIGRIIGGYIHANAKNPARKVKWIFDDLPRQSLKQDLLYSLGASQTICEITRNNAALRFEEIAETRKDPGYFSNTKISSNHDSGKNTINDEIDENVNLSIFSRDQIEKHISTSFVGHSFTRLIGEILKAQGYQVRVSSPGADQGIDILAGKGAIGFDNPKLVVQVKSGDIEADQPTLQGLLGCIEDTRADHGLLVSWSGFKNTVTKRANELFFRVRLWDRDAILDALFSVYSDLPEEIRTELPLKRIWTLVQDDDG